MDCMSIKYNQMKLDFDSLSKLASNSEKYRKELAMMYSNMKSKNDIDNNHLEDMRTSKILTEGHFNKL